MIFQNYLLERLQEQKKKHSYDRHVLEDYDNNCDLGGINFVPMLETTLTEPTMLWITQFREVSNNKSE